MLEQACLQLLANQVVTRGVTEFIGNVYISTSWRNVYERNAIVSPIVTTSCRAIGLGNFKSWALIDSHP